MPARYDRPQDDRVHSKTDILEDRPQRRAVTELLPRAAKMTRNAINVLAVPFEYFQRLRNGRRCSCFSVEDEPQGQCPVCFGTGVVGGFKKRGTNLCVVDVTYPNVRAVNVAPDYASTSRPVNWALSDTAVYGYLDTELRLTQPNIGILDDLTITASAATKESAVLPYIKAVGDGDWVELNAANLQTRLRQTEIGLRVVFRRSSPTAHIPCLAGIRISYCMVPQTSIRVDVPNRTKSITLEEFGIIESFASQQFVFDDTMKVLSTEDFLAHADPSAGGYGRWKLIELKEIKPMGILLGWECQARLVQRFEQYGQVPLGRTVPADQVPPKDFFSAETEAEKGGSPIDPTYRGVVPALPGRMDQRRRP